ncbi:hypothetical protein C8R45DRAFT_389092 [Mycena sanguinolenta]|nr:hypothetical protein C8R45DRAFT_389092 [Mycena sanguinolenta]
MVKGTAGSGKTTLCGQLYNYLVDRDSGARVSIINCNQWDGSVPARSALNAFLHRGHQIDADDRHTCHWVLLDDAHATFQDPSLWIFFKNAPKNFVFIVFALSKPRWKGPSIDGTQNKIRAHQQVLLRPTENGRWSPSPHIPGLYFAAEEYQELVELRQKYDELPALMADLKDWVLEASAGHIGAITSIFDAIKSVARRLHLEEMSMTTFFGSYRSPEEALMDYSRGEAFNRGLPAEIDLQSEENTYLLTFLLDLLRANGPLAFRLHEVPLGAWQAHERGWLTLEQEGTDLWSTVAVSDFPSLLHRSRLSYLLLGSEPLNPRVETMSLLDFVDAVLASFSTIALVQPAQQFTGSHSLPSTLMSETRWLNEFCKCASKVTGGRGLWISPEFGTGKGSGRIDFFVMGSKKWAIEILREGDSLEDHMARFKPGGAYYGWIQGGTIQDYIVLDFGTHTQPLKECPSHANLLHITFIEDFKRYVITNNLLQEVKSGILHE